MAKSIQRTLGPMEVTVVDHARSTVDHGRSPMVNDVDRSVDRERAWLGLVPRAMGKAGLTHKAAAADLQIDRGLLSAQLSGAPNKHLSFRRMAHLPPEFWRELVLLVCDFHDITIGTTAQDAEDMAIGRAFREAVTRVRVSR